ncbi:acyltransferase family protein [Pseudomonadota bacterium]
MLKIISDLHRQLSHPIRDLDSTRRNRSNQIDTLDGLRGFAALMVLTAHTPQNWFVSQTGVGVFVFFALSGWVLSKPYLSRFDGSPNLRDGVHYLVRRVLRIVPLYFVVVFVFWLHGRGYWDAAYLIDHYSFTAGTGHFWSVPSEMRFYLFLPIPIWLCSKLESAWMRVALLAGLSVLSFFVFKDGGLFAIDTYQKTPVKLFLDIFLGGATAAALAVALEKNNIRVPNVVPHTALIAILVFLLLSTESIRTQIPILGETFPSVSFYHFVNPWIVLSIIWVLCCGLVRSGPLHRFWSSDLSRLFGLLTFGIYLLHPLVIWELEHSFELQPGPVFWLVAVLLTTGLSWLAYCFIERPAMNLKRFLR